MKLVGQRPVTNALRCGRLAAGPAGQRREGKLMGGVVMALSRSATHTMIKPNQDSIRLLTGLGVEDDAHLGETVKHCSRVARDPSQPNLRQVHLIHTELHDELRAAGFAVSAGQMGENVTTRGVDLLGLPTGTLLHLGDSAVVEVTGLRNPCAQLNRFQSGPDGGDDGARLAQQPPPKGRRDGHRPGRW